MIVRYLRRTRPDILMATEHYSGLLALYALRLARTPTRCIIRQDNTWGMDSLRLKGRHRLLIPWMLRRLFRYAEIIAVSQGVADDFAKHFPHLRNNISTIYNPVISDALIARRDQPSDHPWLKAGSPPVLVAVGRLQPAKGFDVLIDAFARVVEATPARLLILGEGPDRGALEARIAAHNLQGTCELAGYQPNPYPYMARCSAFVLSSRFEGLPTVLIEALAVGARVIATDCPSGPREILAGGKYGELVPVNDPEAMANAIIGQLANTPSYDPGLKDWLQKFDVDTSVMKHIELIEASLNAPPPHLRSAPLVLTGDGSP
jgi:glycosyltransferase involved in cell wall biosynthesis